MSHPIIICTANDKAVIPLGAAIPISYITFYVFADIERNDSKTSSTGLAMRPIANTFKYRSMVWNEIDIHASICYADRNNLKRDEVIRDMDSDTGGRAAALWMWAEDCSHHIRARAGWRRVAKPLQLRAIQRIWEPKSNRIPWVWTSRMDGWQSAHRWG